MEAVHLDRTVLCIPKGAAMLNPQSKTFLPLPCLLKLPVIYSQWLLAAYRYRFNREREDKVECELKLTF